MCVISGFIEEISDTEILISINDEKTEQLTVYSNKAINNTPDNYMILPVPSIVSNSGIKFIDYTGIDIFSNLKKLFKPRIITNSYDKDLYKSADIEHYEVGSYDIYLCKNIYSVSKDFGIDEDVIKLLDKYYSKNFSFLMCKLKKGPEFKYHPLGYIHKIEENKDVFIPTKHLHIHNLGEEYEKSLEHWDHDIYVYNYSGGMRFSNKIFNNFSNEVSKKITNIKSELKNKDIYDLPDIKFNYGKLDNITKFTIKDNSFINDDLVCSVY